MQSCIKWLMGLLCVAMSMGYASATQNEEEIGKYVVMPKINEEEKKSVRFWVKKLSNTYNDYGYFEDLDFLFVSNKATPSLTLYKLADSKLQELGHSSALVGKYKGNKKKEGDLTTPIGAYDITARFTKLDQYYGPLALATSYPNSYDKSLKKTGSGIWIHGLPLDGNRKEPTTRGCIAIENEILKKYDRLIDWKKTMLITYEGSFHAATKHDLAFILSSLYQWKEAQEVLDIESYLRFYDAGFHSPNGLDLEVFSKQARKNFAEERKRTTLTKKTQIAPNEWREEIYESKMNLAISHINIAVYPNESNQKMYRISFLLRKNRDISIGSIPPIVSTQELKEIKKDMYVVLENNRMKILSEN